MVFKFLRIIIILFMFWRINCVKYSATLQYMDYLYYECQIRYLEKYIFQNN